MSVELHKARLDMLLTEYKEASTAFFKGIDIGLSYARSYFYLNGVLLAATGINEKVIEYLKLDPSLVLVIFPGAALLGMCLSIMFLGLIPYYDRQLDSCAAICIEIETILKSEGRTGSFFKNLQGINFARGRVVTPIRGAKIIPVFFLILWSLIFAILMRQLGVWPFYR